MCKYRSEATLYTSRSERVCTFDVIVPSGVAMKISMAEIMSVSWWKNGWWKHDRENGSCLRKEDTRTPSFRALVPN
jgi:hypothetical protein